MKTEEEAQRLIKSNEALSIGLKAFNMLSEIRKDLQNHKTQLIDGGAAYDSVTVMNVEQIIIKTYLPDGK